MATVTYFSGSNYSASGDSAFDDLIFNDSAFDHSVLDDSILTNAGYTAFEEEANPVTNLRVHRYEFSPTASIEEAANAITTLLERDPQLCFVSGPIDPETLQQKIRACPYLIINGDAVCLSDRTKAPSDLNIKCRDVFFSQAIIREPIECERGHTFEREHIESWVSLKGDVCPHGRRQLHSVGPLEVDLYVEEKIRSILEAYENQARVNRETKEKISTIENRERDFYSLRKSFQRQSILIIATPSSSLLAQAFYQLTGTINAGTDLTQQLTSKQWLQILKKIACEISMQDLYQVIGRISLSHLNNIIADLGITQDSANLLLKKLKILEAEAGNFVREPFHEPFNGSPSFFESLETASRHFIPDHNPSSPWEAQQMVNMCSMVAVGVYFVGMTTGLPGLAAVGGVCATRAAYKYFSNDLPTEIQPCQNLTLYAKAGIFSPLIGRDFVIDRIFSSWNATNATNRMHPLLVGPSGVGKTAIIQEVARRLALFPRELNVPDSLKEGAVYACTAADLLPGNAFEGAEKFERFLQNVRPIQNRAVIVIDEIHTFMNESYKDRFGELMKSVLDTSVRGLPFTLFATTTGEYERYIASSEAIARRFHVIRVELLDKNHTIAVMNQQIRMQNPGLMYDPEVIEYIYDRSEELTLRSNRFKQPEISKNVLSRAISNLQGETETPPSIRLLNKKEGEKQRLLTNLHFNVSINELEEKVMLMIEELDKEIRDLKVKVEEEKRKIKIYNLMIEKFMDSMKAVLNLVRETPDAPIQEFSEEKEKQFKFFSYIVLPEMIAKKRIIENELGIRALDREIIDSIINELASSVIS